MTVETAIIVFLSIAVVALIAGLGVALKMISNANSERDALTRRRLRERRQDARYARRSQAAAHAQNMRQARQAPPKSRCLFVNEYGEMEEVDT